MVPSNHWSPLRKQFAYNNARAESQRQRQPVIEVSSRPTVGDAQISFFRKTLLTELLPW